MGDERPGPAAADGRAVADHGAGADRAVAGAPAEAVFAARAGLTGVEAALRAGEHGIDDHAGADGPVAGCGAGLRDPADVLVAERERVGAERLQREAVVGRDGRQVAAADPGKSGLDADP